MLVSQLARTLFSGSAGIILDLASEADRFAFVLDNQAGPRVVTHIVTSPDPLRPEPGDTSVRDPIADVVQDQHRALFGNTIDAAPFARVFLLFSNKAIAALNERVCRGRICSSAKN